MSNQKSELDLRREKAAQERWARWEKIESLISQNERRQIDVEREIEISTRQLNCLQAEAENLENSRDGLHFVSVGSVEEMEETLVLFGAAEADAAAMAAFLKLLPAGIPLPRIHLPSVTSALPLGGDEEVCVEWETGHSTLSAAVSNHPSRRWVTLSSIRFDLSVAVDPTVPLPDNVITIFRCFFPLR